jgi:hypothetical protein
MQNGMLIGMAVQTEQKSQAKKNILNDPRKKRNGKRELLS